MQTTTRLITALLSLIILSAMPPIAIADQGTPENQYELGLGHGIGWIYLNSRIDKAPYAAPNQEASLFFRHAASGLGLSIDYNSIVRASSTHGKEKTGGYDYLHKEAGLTAKSVTLRQEWNLFGRLHAGLGVGAFRGNTYAERRLGSYSDDTADATERGEERVSGIKLDPSLRVQIKQGTIGMDVKINAPAFKVLGAASTTDDLWISYPLPTIAAYWSF